MTHHITGEVQWKAGIGEKGKSGGMMIIPTTSAMFSAVSIWLHILPLPPTLAGRFDIPNWNIYPSIPLFIPPSLLF